MLSATSSHRHVAGSPRHPHRLHANAKDDSAAARCVVADPAADGHWLMFYEALDGARRRTIGLARSADGEAWVRGEA